MRRILLLAVMLSALMCSAQSVFFGDWTGQLQVMGSKLTIVFHISPDKCTLDSPDQNAKGIPAQFEMVNDSTCSVSVAMLGAKFVGSINDDQLVGTFSQRGLNLPLALKRGAPVVNRPQTPQPPFPYKTEEIAFKSAWDGAELSGTLTLADNPNAPLVIMVSGSGQQDRDETIFDHKPFLVFADRLARNGISSFRYDDRGVGKSGGLRPDITTATNRDDVISAFRAVKAAINASKVGILGHSEGASIAFMTAAFMPDSIDFIVSMAGPGERGDSILLRQITEAMPGVTREMAMQSVKMQTAANQWLAFFANYDPAADIAAVRCPVLAINGETDCQVPAHPNIDIISRLMQPNALSVTKIYSGLNHLFQHSPDGNPSNYSKIEETISDEVVDDIILWINKIPR